MSERGIRPNDTVLHRPTGETWVVAGVSLSTGELVPSGYPFPSVAKIEDCDLLEKGYEAKPQDKDVIEAFQKEGMLKFIDVRSAMLHGII